MTKVCVTGFQGRLGSALVLAGCEPLDCDITNPETIKQALFNKNYDVLINCAALANVDGAEKDDKEYEKYIQVNTRGVANLRDAFHGKMIQISTDYVFSGENGPYKENSRMEAPVNKYGYSKLGAEAIMIGFAHIGSTIVRTTGLFGSQQVKTDLAHLVIDEVRKGNPIDITRSLLGNQTYIPFLAEHLIQLAEMSNPPRILHLASSDVISRYEFALMVCSVYGLDKSYVMPTTNGSKDLGWKAKRPTKAGLKVDLATKLGFVPYTVLEGLQDMFEMEQKGK